MDKVKLPKQVAEAIEELRSKGYSEYDFACFITRKESAIAPVREVKTIRVWYNTEGDMGIFMKALVNGYEVEMTPEEKIRELFKQNIPPAFPESKDDFYKDGIQDGIRETLKLLGIKISGVNEL